MARQTRISDSVFLHLQSIKSYYQPRNPKAAENILGEIENAMALVSANPESFPICHFAPSTHSLVVGRYSQFSIIYTFDDQFIDIHAVWDSRQDPDKLAALLIGQGV